MKRPVLQVALHEAVARWSRKALVEAVLWAGGEYNRKGAEGCWPLRPLGYGIGEKLLPHNLLRALCAVGIFGNLDEYALARQLNHSARQVVIGFTLHCLGGLVGCYARRLTIINNV